MIGIVRLDGSLELRWMWMSYLEAEIDLSGADNLGDILWRVNNVDDLNGRLHTLGSLGSRMATLIPSSLKYPSL